MSKRRFDDDEERAEGKRVSYANLTEPQRLQWHAGVYAFRRVVLGVPAHEHTSPCDPNGKWFNEYAVAVAETALRERFAEQSKRCAADTAARNAIRFADADAWRERTGRNREAVERLNKLLELGRQRDRPPEAAE